MFVLLNLFEEDQFADDDEYDDDDDDDEAVDVDANLDEFEIDLVSTKLIFLFEINGLARQGLVN